MKFEEQGNIRYFQKGANPQLVIHAGTHGDEYHLIPSLSTVVEQLSATLPSFLYIPETSPSAVAAKQRENQYGHDINRHFGAISDPEIAQLKHLTTLTKNALAISFHEDLERDAFYLYDSSSLPESQISVLQHTLRKMNVPLFSGIDDPEDEALAYRFVDGYSPNVGKPSLNGQFIEDWAIYQGYFSRMLTFEIPYKHDRLTEILEHCIIFSLTLLP